MRAALRRILGRPAAPARSAEGGDRELAALSDADRRIIERALPYTMTGVRPAPGGGRRRALLRGARDLPGAFAECGVWRGGSVLAMILTLQELGVGDRDIHLYDTFEGMTEPTEHDTSHRGPARPGGLERRRQRGASGRGRRCSARRSSARRASAATLLATGYPPERLHLVRGPGRGDPPRHARRTQLALLRLDTDWYESTRHELEHLYPRLCDGGVLIIDDYGHWEGARQAVDEYFDAQARAAAAQPDRLHRPRSPSSTEAPRARAARAGGRARRRAAPPPPSRPRGHGVWRRCSK